MGPGHMGGGPPPVDCAVHHGWCVDMRVPASTCAKTKPKGLPHPSQEEKAPTVVTPPAFTLDPS